MKCSYNLKPSIPQNEVKCLGAEVKKLREKRGMTMTDLARDSSMSISYISMLENGEIVRPPAYTKIRNLEKSLGTETGHLLVLAKSAGIVKMTEILPSDDKGMRAAIVYLERLKDQK